MREGAVERGVQLRGGGDLRDPDRGAEPRRLDEQRQPERREHGAHDVRPGAPVGLAHRHVGDLRRARGGEHVLEHDLVHAQRRREHARRRRTGTSSSSSRPWTVPSSPNGPCRTGKTASAPSRPAARVEREPPAVRPVPDAVAPQQHRDDLVARLAHAPRTRPRPRRARPRARTSARRAAPRPSRRRAWGSASAWARDLEAPDGDRHPRARARRMLSGVGILVDDDPVLVGRVDVGLPHADLEARVLERVAGVVLRPRRARRAPGRPPARWRRPAARCCRVRPPRRPRDPARAPCRARRPRPPARSRTRRGRPAGAPPRRPPRDCPTTSGTGHLLAAARDHDRHRGALAHAGALGRRRLDHAALRHRVGVLALLLGPGTRPRAAGRSRRRRPGPARSGSAPRPARSTR